MTGFAKFLTALFGLMATSAVISLLSVSAQKKPVQHMEYLSPKVRIEKLYPSMFGPVNVKADLKMMDDEGQPELLWITGYRAEMVGPNDLSRRSQEVMCHNSLNINWMASDHRKVLGSGHYETARLFTLAQGQWELQLPEGFGIPVSSSERLLLGSQVLNSRPELIGTEVRHRVRTDFILDRAAGPMEALAVIMMNVEVLTAGEEGHPSDIDLLGCARDAGGQGTGMRNGKTYTGHWFVPPGEEMRRTVLKRRFPFDTTVHYIATHMHPYGRSLELRDRTADKTIFKALCTPTADGLGLQHVDEFSSRQGVPVYKDHEYELICHYNNSSEQDVTAMAYMYCYIKDPTFKKPEPERLAVSSEEFCKPAHSATQVRGQKKGTSATVTTANRRFKGKPTLKKSANL